MNIPAGRRHTSRLFTERSRGVVLEANEKKSNEKRVKDSNLGHRTTSPAPLLLGHSASSMLGYEFFLPKFICNKNIYMSPCSFKSIWPSYLLTWSIDWKTIPSARNARAPIRLITWFLCAVQDEQYWGITSTCPEYLSVIMQGLQHSWSMQKTLTENDIGKWRWWLT